jgi:glycosyltransferase involved in cell wall biosynthesis
MNASAKVGVVIPARDEASGLDKILPVLMSYSWISEVLVINDGSVDATADVCKKYGARVISQPYPMGNGAAIKTGARATKCEIIIFMDGDGQHKPEDISELLEKFNEGYDMVVGSRRSGSQAGVHRAVANDIFSRFASWMVMQPITDLTSGFRVVKASKFKQFLYLLPNGFSYPTTITMSFFRAGYAVAYVPIHAPKRESGKSHIHPMRDGLRFLLIIIKIGTLFSPQKLFLPISAGFFVTGVVHYLYTYFTVGRFTNMSALLLISAVFTFLIGIVSEQISALHYKNIDTTNDENP